MHERVVVVRASHAVEDAVGGDPHADPGRGERLLHALLDDLFEQGEPPVEVAAVLVVPLVRGRLKELGVSRPARGDVFWAEFAGASVDVF